MSPYASYRYASDCAGPELFDHEVRPSFVLGCLAFIFVLFAALPATATEGDERFRAAIRVADSSDRELVERVKGQTSDLAVELVEHSAEPLESSLDAALETADDIGDRVSARAVIWFRRAGMNRVRVFVAVPHGQVFERSISEGDASADATSATLEAAALVVRGALLALMRAQTIGVPRREALLHEAHGATGSPMRPSPKPDARPAVSTPRPMRLFTAIGGLGVITHDEASVTPALAMRGGLAVSRFDIGLAFELGSIDEREDGVANLRVRRHVGELYVAALVHVAPRLQVGAGVAAGAVAFVRSTHPNGAGVLPTPSRAVIVPLIAPELHVRWNLSARLALAAVVGVDAVLRSPVFYYASAGDPDRLLRVWPVEPRAGLLIDVR